MAEEKNRRKRLNRMKKRGRRWRENDVNNKGEGYSVRRIKVEFGRDKRMVDCGR